MRFSQSVAGQSVLVPGQRMNEISFIKRGIMQVSLHTAWVHTSLHTRIIKRGLMLRCSTASTCCSC